MGVLRTTTNIVCPFEHLNLDGVTQPLRCEVQPPRRRRASSTCTYYGHAERRWTFGRVLVGIAGQNYLLKRHTVEWVAPDERGPLEQSGYTENSGNQTFTRHGGV